MEAHNASTDELPAIKSREVGRNTSTLVFDNGAKLRMSAEEGQIYEEVFAPSDSDSVMERNWVGSGDDVEAFLDEAEAMYKDYDSREAMLHDWSTLAEWITHD